MKTLQRYINWLVIAVTSAIAIIVDGPDAVGRIPWWAVKLVAWVVFMIYVARVVFPHLRGDHGAEKDRRRGQIVAWRLMVNGIRAVHNEHLKRAESEESNNARIEAFKAYLSLRPHLSGPLPVGTLKTKLDWIADEIDRIEGEWGLR